MNDEACFLYVWGFFVCFGVWGLWFWLVFFFLIFCFYFLRRSCRDHLSVVMWLKKSYTVSLGVLPIKVPEPENIHSRQILERTKLTINHPLSVIPYNAKFSPILNAPISSYHPVQALLLSPFLLYQIFLNPSLIMQLIPDLIPSKVTALCIIPSKMNWVFRSSYLKVSVTTPYSFRSILAKYSNGNALDLFSKQQP